MDMTARIQGYQYLEILLSNGHKLRTLPISKQKAEAIMSCRYEPTPAELEALRQAVDKSAVPKAPVVEF